MLYRILADIVVLVHLAFILFVTLGGFLVLKWHKLAWIHLPLVLWGIIVEFGNFICPLTPWENNLRRLGGDSAYQGDFIEHYIMPIIYPEDLTRTLQILFGSVVILINVIIYGIILFRRGKRVG